jgi:hypothetical protein
MVFITRNYRLVVLVSSIFRDQIRLSLNSPAKGASSQLTMKDVLIIAYANSHLPGRSACRGSILETTSERYLGAIVLASAETAPCEHCRAASVVYYPAWLWWEGRFAILRGFQGCFCRHRPELIIINRIWLLTESFWIYRLLQNWLSTVNKSLMKV